MKEALFLGESNPYGRDPRYALYPEPANSAGGRLCRLILGLTPREYIRRFDRVNLCAGPWKLKQARSAAEQFDYQRRSGFPVVLFGAKVCAAWGVPFRPFEVAADRKAGLIVLPHPSGLCRTWHREPDATQRARQVLKEAGIDLTSISAARGQAIEAGKVEEGDRTAGRMLKALLDADRRGDLIRCQDPHHNDDVGCQNPECWNYPGKATPRPDHTFTGNCFFGLTDEACKEHGEWRGECPKCAPCLACRSGEPG